MFTDSNKIQQTFGNFSIIAEHLQEVDSDKDKFFYLADKDVDYNF